MVRPRAFAFTLLATAGCANVLGLDEYRSSFADAGGGGDGGCACVPVAPAGWTGPVAYWEALGQPPPAPPSCPGDYPAVLHDGHASPDAPPSTCTCACDVPAGLVCGAVTITQRDNNCQTTCGTLSVPAGTCADVTPCGSGWDIGPVSLAAGACAPKVSGTVTPAWSWRGAVRVCATVSAGPAAGCAASEVCARLPSAPFGAAACVVATGDLACPAGYPVRHVTFDGAADTRDCACACGAPTGVDCSSGVHVRTFDQTACAGAKKDDWTSLPRACAGTSPDGATQSVDLVTTAPKGGTCAPSAAMPVGAVTPQGPTTVCCAG